MDCQHEAWSMANWKTTGEVADGLPFSTYDQGIFVVFVIRMQNGSWLTTLRLTA